MVSVLASSPGHVKPKIIKLVICYFSAMHAELRRRSKNWLARNQDNVFEWSDMSIRGLLFQSANTTTNPTQRVGLVQRGPYHHLIENQLVLDMI